MAIENKYKVRLIPASRAQDKSSAGSLTFDASPTISESRTVNYNSLEPLHAPGQIQVYKNTASRTFQISDIKLLSRTLGEAEENLKKLWTLRSWCMPRFGNSTTLTETNRAERDIKSLNEQQGLPDTGQVYAVGNELLGSPPPILYFSAYSRVVGSTNTPSATNIKTPRWDIAQHINRIPTVIVQLNIPYPNDVDYIVTKNGVMPIIMNIDISLLETHSPNAYEAFDLSAFKEGRLRGF